MCGIAGGVFWGGRIARRDAEAAVSAMVAKLATADRTATACFCRPDAWTIESRLRFSVTRGWRFWTSATPALSRWAATREPRASLTTARPNFLALKRELERAAPASRLGPTPKCCFADTTPWGVDVLRGFAACSRSACGTRRIAASSSPAIVSASNRSTTSRPTASCSSRRKFARCSQPGWCAQAGCDRPLWQYSGYQSIPAPRTLVDGVRMLDAGSWLVADEPDARRAASAGTCWTARPAPRRRSIHKSQADRWRSPARRGLQPSGQRRAGRGVLVRRDRFERGRRPDARSRRHAAHVLRRLCRAKLRREASTRRSSQKFAADHTHIRLDEHDLLGHLPGALRAWICRPVTA